MTSRQNSNNSHNSKVAAAFCKVCHDAGKSIEVYTSHFVKSIPGPKGIVICPTLLGQACTFCLKSGHTVSYCLELKKRNSARARNQKREEYNDSQSNTSQAVHQPKQSVNKFAALYEDAEVTVAVKPTVVEAFPLLCQQSATAVAQPKKMFSYASMASKPQSSLDADQISLIPLSGPRRTTEPVKVVKQPVVKRSWADWTDSEDDAVSDYEVEDDAEF
jgi:hypothetical protein